MTGAVSKRGIRAGAFLTTYAGLGFSGFNFAVNGFASVEAGVETEGFDGELSFRAPVSGEGVGVGTAEDVVVWAKEFRRQENRIKIITGIFLMKPRL